MAGRGGERGVARVLNCAGPMGGVEHVRIVRAADYHSFRFRLFNFGVPCLAPPSFIKANILC